MLQAQHTVRDRLPSVLVNYSETLHRAQILSTIRLSFRICPQNLLTPGAGAVGLFGDIVINKKTFNKSNINQPLLTILGISMHFRAGNRSRIL